MSFFKVRWGDIQRDFAKKVELGNLGVDTPIKFYFENESSIFPIIRLRGAFLYAEIPKSSLKSLGNFKLEFCSDAYELMNNPIEGRLNTLVAQY